MDQRVKIKENENRKISPSSLNMKKLWNKSVKVMPIIIGALGAAPEIMEELVIERKIETAQEIQMLGDEQEN